MSQGASYELIQVYASLMVIILPLGVPLLWLLHLRRLRPHLDPDAYVKRAKDNGDEGKDDTASDNGAESAQSSDALALSEAVLGTSPLEPLFTGLDPQFSWWFDVADMYSTTTPFATTVIATAVSTATPLHRSNTSLLSHCFCT